jgi:hypothetical protein
VSAFHIRCRRKPLRSARDGHADPIATKFDLHLHEVPTRFECQAQFGYIPGSGHPLDVGG